VNQILSSILLLLAFLGCSTPQSKQIFQNNAQSNPNAVHVSSPDQVIVDITISKTGEPIKADVIAGAPRLRARARADAMKMRFKPAKKDGNPIESHFTCILNYPGLYPDGTPGK